MRLDSLVMYFTAFCERMVDFVVVPKRSFSNLVQVSAKHLKVASENCEKLLNTLHFLVN